MEIVFLLLAFVVAQLVGVIGKKRQRERAAGRSPDERPKDLLAELRGALEEMQRQGKTETPIGGKPPTARSQGPMGRRLATPRPGSQAGGVESDPTVVSLETPVLYEERELVDYDDEIEALVARRIKYAEAQARALTPADHKKFDKRIRAAAPPPPPRVRSARALRRQRLRDLFVAKEVLGRPVALRDPFER